MCRDCYETKPIPSSRSASTGRTQRAAAVQRCPQAVSGGFSLIEVLIASVLLLVIALGVIPLFVRAIGLNQEGQASSQISVIASSELERLNQLPWDAPELTIPGSDLEVVLEQYQLEPAGEWKPAADVDPDDGFHFHRILRLRQFGFGALDDGKLAEEERLAGDTVPAALVQLKEVLIQVESGKRPGAARRAVTMRLMRTI